MSTTLSAIVTALEPWKAVIASTAGFLAAVLGILGGVLKQRKVADTTTMEPNPFTPRHTVARMHPDDRDAISDVRSCIEDLTRETRRNTKATEENTEALNRRGGGRR